MGKNIYNLGLHECISDISEDASIKVMRVPDGWIYNIWGKQTFVKYSDEFQNKAETLKELFPPEEKTTKFNFKKSLIELGVEEIVASDWLKVRSKKKAANTETAFNGIKKQIQLTTKKANDCIKLAVEKSWAGFKAEWFFNENGTSTGEEGAVEW